MSRKKNRKICQEMISSETTQIDSQKGDFLK